MDANFGLTPRGEVAIPIASSDAARMAGVSIGSVHFRCVGDAWFRAEPDLLREP